ncbi:hypothetical protein BRAO285_1300020 [Bradyrhizobium sp. ORS 285]|nr:hypothetical protein BRAO285_1300020 [Bradyrhizobium sp. ORS 285]
MRRVLMLFAAQREELGLLRKRPTTPVGKK